MSERLISSCLNLLRLADRNIYKVCHPIISMEIPQEEPNSFADTTKESIELTRNNKGVYAWKIKLKEEVLSPEKLHMLDAINEKMEGKYGNKGN